MDRTEAVPPLADGPIMDRTEAVPPGVRVSAAWEAVAALADRTEAVPPLADGPIMDHTEVVPPGGERGAVSTYEVTRISSPRYWLGVYWPRTQAKIRGAQMVASLSTTNLGVLAASLPQVIFSLGTAPE